MSINARQLAPGAVYHITHRGNNRMPIFNTDQDRAVYLKYLEEALDGRSFKVHAYCLMGNHIHMLVSADDPLDIPAVLQLVHGRYGRYFNLSWHRSGSVWHRRYRSKRIETDEHLIRSFQYLDMNPVRKRMVSRPDEWEWSSYRSLASGKPSPVLSLHESYAALGKDTTQRCLAYRARMDQFLAEWLALSSFQ